MQRTLQDQIHEIANSARRAPGKGLVIGLGGTARVRNLAADTIARELGRRLLRISPTEYAGMRPDQIGPIWTRYIRDTRSGSILLFDEADALFGKRTDVKDSHDKYANADVSYLLAKLAELPGVVLVSCGTRPQGGSSGTIGQWLECHRWP